MLLSINPQHVERIMSGEKRFEFRRNRCKREVDKIIIYATAPIQKVVAEVSLLDILEGTIEEVWEQTKEYAGVKKEFYNHYFEGKETAFAYKLDSVKIYDEPLSLEHFGVKQAPQSYQYIV